MAFIRLGPFLGANTALRPKLLPNNVGVNSQNHRPDQGDLRPWRAPLNVKTIAAGIKTIFIMPRDAVSDTIYWFVWNTVVHAVKSFKASNPTKRTYFTGSGAPKATDNVLGLAGEPYPTTYRDLGIPKPLTAPIVTQTAAGTGADETRFYAYTYVSDWDEEGPPQVSAMVTCKPGATFDITNIAAPPSGAGESRGINRVRIYRTLAGDTGSAFYFLRDVALPAVASTDPALTPGEDVLPSKLYAMPPTDLKNLIAMWNGIMAGISGNSVRYCELNKPHAWPVAYETLCPETPIALAVFKKTLLILTTGRPRVVNGTLPESMDDDPLEFIAPCLSPQSVVSLGHGVCWASSQGIAYVGDNGPPRILTAGIMTPEAWASLTPSTMVFGQYRGLLMCFYDSGAGMKGFMIDPMQPENGFYGISTGFTAVYYDQLEEQLYGVNGTSIQKWNAGPTNMAAVFESKTFRMTSPVNMAVGEVIADAYPVTLTLYADARPNVVKIINGRAPFTLPAGYLADDYHVRVETSNDVTGVVIATSLNELAQT